MGFNLRSSAGPAAGSALPLLATWLLSRACPGLASWLLISRPPCSSTPLPCGTSPLRISPSTPYPARYPLAARRAALRQDAISFCDRFGAEAHRLGWTPAELFAVHPGHGTLRMDHCGVFMVVSESAMAVEAQRIVFERLTGYRSTVGQQLCISVWKFARKGVGR